MKMNDYHDYVITDGRFIGLFDQMYRECADPWNASKEDYDASACTVAAKQFIHSLGHVGVVSLGSGTGRHLAWLDCEGDGVEVSRWAVAISRISYPDQFIFCKPIIQFFLEYQDRPDIEWNVFLFREILWYILPEWKTICDILATHHGARVIVELSFYDEQHYGLDYFNGPDDFIQKWPFTIEKIVREHTTKQQREGRVLVIGRVP